MKAFFVFSVIAGAVVLAQAWLEQEVPNCVDTSPEGAKIEPQADCRKCQAMAIAHKKCVPTCKTVGGNKTDFFDPMQRCKDEVWCVDMFGHEYNGSRTTTNGDINCTSYVTQGQASQSKCEVHAAEAVKNDEDYIPTCIGPGLPLGKVGDYAPLQSYGKGASKLYAWCALKNGNYIPGTFHEGTAVNPPICLLHYMAVLGCKNEPLIAHPFECERYVQCGRRIYSCICGKNQRFNPTLKTCDWKDNVKC